MKTITTDTSACCEGVSLPSTRCANGAEGFQGVRVVPGDRTFLWLRTNPDPRWIAPA